MAQYDHKIELFSMLQLNITFLDDKDFFKLPNLVEY